VLDERKGKMKEPWGIILILGGLFAIVCAVCDWEWFMNSRKARVFVNWLGRNGARAFYCILGLVIAFLGVLITFGIVGAGQ
jgi:small neutral amino acid transporter SnatA (MarC family)